MDTVTSEIPAAVKTVRVAVVGYGYWGPNLARNFSEVGRTSVGAICDSSRQRLELAERRYPRAIMTTKYDDVLRDAAIDLVAIATPIGTHFDLAKRALLAGKDIFVEKPLCTNTADARELQRIAENEGCRVFVDHTFVYNPAVVKMREVMRGESFGRPLYYDSVRANLGLFQADFNVLWDLAPHDLSILDYVLDGAVPKTVSCIGAAHFNERHNIVYLTLTYADDFIAHCHLSWLAPVKIRQTIVAGSQKFLIYNDNDTAERIKVYDKGVDLAVAGELSETQRIQYRVGDVHAPFVANQEALHAEAEHVAACYFDGATPRSGIESGVNMVRILEAAQESLLDGGAPRPLR